MAKRKAVPRSAMARPVPPAQGHLPFTFNSAGDKMITLAEAAGSNRGDSKAISALSLDELSRITAARIDADASFQLGIIGVGFIDRERAKSELEKKSDVAQVIAGIEKLLLEQLHRDYVPQ